MRKTTASLGVLFVMLWLAGCTHVQLKRNTVRQAFTVGDIQQQQVLNNLARFVYDINSLPSFSIPTREAQRDRCGSVGLSRLEPLFDAGQMRHSC